jgi:hypothetical protein
VLAFAGIIFREVRPYPIEIRIAEELLAFGAPRARVTTREKDLRVWHPDRWEGED